MAAPIPTYQQRVAAEKRSAILSAAMRLFIENGFGGTSLARIADAAKVSTATLFKQFPTKADLFEAIVVDFWTANAPESEDPRPHDPRAGLRQFGRQYAELLARPGMVGLHRMVIAEAPRFPELAKIQFDLGKEPFFGRVHAYLVAADEASALSVPDATVAAAQFLGMISNLTFWPKLLLVDWRDSPSQSASAVDSAVEVVLAAYAGNH